MLARLFGKSDVYSFKIEIFGDVKTFDFLKIQHHESGEVLTQVINITRDSQKLIGDCKIIGFREAGVLKNIRTPFSNEALIEIADDSFIEKTVGLNSQDDAFLGLLEHHPELKITMDLKKTITKHIAVLAKSGAGKSYTVGVLLEEIIKKNIPIIILDPHNEYSSLKYPNTDKKDVKRLEKFGLKPEGFLDRIKEYSPDTSSNPQCESVTLDINSLKPQDLIDALPQKLSPAQQALMFNILSNLNNRVDFDELIFNISNEESNAKWSLISLIEQLKKFKLYSSNPTPLQELVKYKRASIISLKGVDPYVQETFVAGLLRDLFEARKKEEIPPFFLVLEEAHNFCVTKETKIMTSEGPKEISKLKEDIGIISYNNLKNKFELDDIKKIHSKRKAKIIELNTKSGQKIKCTPDHPIWDRNNYVEAQYAQEVSIPLIDQYSLKEKLIQARLFGALYSDGWVSKNNQVGFSGKYEDMLKIKEELEFLGLKSSKVSTFENKLPSTINKADGKMISISGKGSSISCSKNVYDYFMNLGSIEGEKVIQETKIPNFIKNGSKEIKAEFLAGLLGGDGLKLIPMKRNFNCVKLYFTKLKKLKDLGDKYANQIMDMFKELNINTSLSYRSGNIRKKDGEETLKYIISISNEDNNLINFIENVGYRYNQEKEVLAKKALIYLKSKKTLIENQEVLRKKALSIKEKDGVGKVKIAQILNLPVTLVAKWIYNGKNYSNSAGLSKSVFPEYLIWDEENCDDNFIYDEILFSESKGEDFVYNITTRNENYIANGMLLHNCPESSMGKLKSSSIIRTIAGEGRKFGIGLCAITQRPAKVDKNVISQCTTQILLKITNPNDLKSVIASSEGVDSSSENEIQKLNIGTCLLTGVIDIPLKTNIRPRVSKHGGETVDITMPYEAENGAQNHQENVPSYGGQVNETHEEEVHREEISRPHSTPKKYEGANTEFIQYIAPEIDVDDAKSMLGTNSISVEMIPASIIKLKQNGAESSILFDRVHKKIIKTLFPFEGSDVPEGLGNLSDTENKILKVILELGDSFNPAELLIKTDVMFNEILRVCDSLANKNILRKNGKEFELTGGKFLKDITSMNFFGKQLFEEVSFDSKLDEKISESQVRTLFSNFGDVTNIKEIFMLRYRAK